jgi:hypothetical protein
VINRVVFFSFLVLTIIFQGGYGSTSRALVWQSNGWMNGSNSQYPRGVKISSYTVLDQMVQYFDNKTMFPKLTQIVVGGHSAGAQTVQRWAAVSTLKTTIPYSIWIGNPNSLLWLSEDRPLDTSNCPTYDYWKEGLTAYPNDYAASLVASGRAAVLANYNSKTIAYARGMQDLGDDSSTCSPYSQGSNRNERFFNFIKRFPVSYPSTIDFVNAGHDGGAMMASQAGLFLDNFNGNGTLAYDFGCPRMQAGDDPNPSGICNSIAAPADAGVFNGFTYQGCYTDKSAKRALGFQAFVGSNSASLCTAACQAAGYSVAGMEFGDECYCGSSISAGNQGPLLEAACTMSCSSNSSQICGGPSRISVFSIGNVTIDTTPVSPPSTGNYTYQGCWTDTGARVLQGVQSSTNDMTVEKCGAFCAAAGTNAFGVEYANREYCSNLLYAQC